MVGDPAYTLLDALADLFKENNGQNWMFSFAKDFGFTSMDQFKLAASAVVADSLEDVCRFFEEEGMDTEGMSPEEVEEASEVFPLSDGRYLIVEG